MNIKSENERLRAQLKALLATIEDKSKLIKEIVKSDDINLIYDYIQSGISPHLFVHKLLMNTKYDETKELIDWLVNNLDDNDDSFNISNTIAILLYVDFKEYAEKLVMVFSKKYPDKWLVNICYSDYLGEEEKDTKYIEKVFNFWKDKKVNFRIGIDTIYSRTSFEKFKEYYYPELCKLVDEHYLIAHLYGVDYHCRKDNDKKKKFIKDKSNNDYLILKQRVDENELIKMVIAQLNEAKQS